MECRIGKTGVFFYFLSRKILQIRAERDFLSVGTNPRGRNPSGHDLTSSRTNPTLRSTWVYEIEKILFNFVSLILQILC